MAWAAPKIINLFILYKMFNYLLTKFFYVIRQLLTIPDRNTLLYEALKDPIKNSCKENVFGTLPSWCLSIKDGRLM